MTDLILLNYLKKGIKEIEESKDSDKIKLIMAKSKIRAIIETIEEDLDKEAREHLKTRDLKKLYYENF